MYYIMQISGNVYLYWLIDYLSTVNSKMGYKTAVIQGSDGIQNCIWVTIQIRLLSCIISAQYTEGICFHSRVKSLYCTVMTLAFIILVELSYFHSIMQVVKRIEKCIKILIGMEIYC